MLKISIKVKECVNGNIYWRILIGYFVENMMILTFSFTFQHFSIRILDNSPLIISLKRTNLFLYTNDIFLCTVVANMNASLLMN